MNFCSKIGAFREIDQDMRVHDASKRLRIVLEVRTNRSLSGYRESDRKRVIDCHAMTTNTTKAAAVAAGTMLFDDWFDR